MNRRLKTVDYTDLRSPARNAEEKDTREKRLAAYAKAANVGRKIPYRKKSAK